MNKEELLKLLNSLARYELEDIGSGYSPENNLVKRDWGENIKAEELAKAFGLKFDCFKGFSE